MSSLRNGGEPSTSKIPESADATKSTDDYEPVKPVKKTVIYKKTIVYNFTKVFAAKAEAATLKQLSSAERLLSADSQLSVAEVRGPESDAQSEVPKPVEEITEKEEAVVSDQSSAVSIDATLEEVLLQIMPTLPSVPPPPRRLQPQAVQQPPSPAAPAIPADAQASLSVALADVVPPKAGPKVLKEKPFCFEDYWEERWVGRDNQPAEVFTMSSSVTVKPAEKAATPVVNEQVPEVRTYTAPFRANDRLNDLAASPVLPAAVKPRKKPDSLKTKENQPRQERNSTAKEKSAKAKEPVVPSPAFTPRVLAPPAKRKADEAPSKQKPSRHSSPAETLRKSLPVISDADDLTKRATVPSSPGLPQRLMQQHIPTGWVRVDAQIRAAEGLGSGLVPPRDLLLVPNFALGGTSSVSADEVLPSVGEAAQHSPHYPPYSPAQVGSSPARDPRRQPKTSEEKLAQRNVSLSPTLSGSSSVGKSRVASLPGAHLSSDSYWTQAVQYFDALLKMDVQETFRLTATPLRQAPTRPEVELPLAPNSREYIKIMHQNIVADLEKKAKEAVRQCRIPLESIPLNVQHKDFSHETKGLPGRVHLGGLVDELKDIHPFDFLLMVFTPQRSRGDGDSRSGEPQRLYTFGLVQNSKQIDAREHKLIVYVADKHFAKLASARIKDNPRRPTHNAAVLPLLSLKNVDNWIFGLLTVFGLKQLSSRPYPLTNAWTELTQSFFEYTLPSNLSPFPFELKVNASQKEAILAIADCFHQEKNKAVVRVVLGAAHTGKMRVLAGALSLSLQKSSKGQFLILVPSAADLERVARNLVTEWRALHDTEIQMAHTSSRQHWKRAPLGIINLNVLLAGFPISHELWLQRETLISNSIILLPENASPTSSYIKSTLEVLHKHPTFLDESKVLDEQIEKVRKQLATGLTAAGVPVKSSPEVLTAELERFMKTRSDLLASAVSRAFGSKEKLAKDLDVYVKDNIHAKNVLLAPLSFFLEDNQQAHINYGMLPPLDGIFVYDAGRYTELELLLALTRFPSADTSAPKVVLIGDHMSLPLDSDGQELSAGLLSSSLLHRYFKRYGLLTDNVSLALKVQHHTDQDIFRYANTAFYSNILSNNTLRNIPNLDSYHFFDLHGLDHTHKEGKEGMDDAEYAVRFAKALLADGQENLGKFVILTRTTNYCQKLRDLAEYELPNTEVHTVASFQSRVADTVLFCADAAGLKEGECAWEEKRICQAMSAARKHLFILGHVKNLKVNKAWLDVNNDAGKRRKKDAILVGAGGELVSPERVLEKLKPAEKVKH